MKNLRDTSLQIRLAGLAVIGLFIALGAVAYLSGQQVKRDSALVAKDAVPGMIDAHQMRMAMSRSIGWAMVAASAQTAQSRDDSLKIVHDADTAFTNAAEQYKATIKINPGRDTAILEEVTSRYVKYQQQRMAYEALILAGDRDGSAVFLERDLVPAYVLAIKSAEELLDYNNANSIAYADHIRDSVHQLYWAVAVVLTLALICAAVLIVSLSIRRREVIELRESEEKFSKAFQSNPVGIAITEMATGSYIEVNESFCRIMGYSSQELMGHTTVERGIWGGAEERKRGVESLLAGHTIRDMELQTRAKDGGSRTVLIDAEMIELGGKRCIVSLVQDITERKQAVEQLEMLKVSIDQHFDGTYWMDINNRFIYVNDASCKALGYTREELLGQPVTLVAPAATPQILEEVWAQLRETGFFAREGVHRRKDGSEFPVEVVASYVRFEGKEFNCGFARDITERKRTEEALLWRTAFFEAQVDSALDGILVVDRDGRKILQNQRMSDLWGIPPEIAANDDDAQQIAFIRASVKDCEPFVEKVAYLYAHPDEVGRDEIELINGTILDRFSAPVRDKAGRHYGRIWTFRDVTKERSREEKLAQALALEKELSEKARAGERAKGEFLAVMSHEVRTPLNGILGFSELLARTQLPPKSVEYVETIKSSGEALLRILNDVLDFSRIEAGHLPIEKIRFAPREILAEIHNLFALPAARRKLKFEISPGTNIPEYLSGDANRIRQVLLNLVGNAVKFTDSGSVTLGMQRKGEGSTYEFIVKDNGPGIAHDQIDHIFLPFTQADSSISRRHGGAGLGLSISRRLAELMGGTLQVRSDPGHGAEFIFAVPLDEVDGSRKESGGGAALKLDAAFASQHPLRILIVEDDKINLKLILTLLRRLGYAPLGAMNGREAVEVFEKERPDCVVMDLQMPEMDGIEATEKIREMERHLPRDHPTFISALTANIVPADRQRCFDAGMNAYMNKPVKIDTLAELLAKAGDVAAHGITKS